RMRSIIAGLPAVLLLCMVATGQEGSQSPSADVKHVEVNGARLAYIERGSGTPVVFVHGAISDYRTWAAQLEPFSKRYRVISYSRRYHYPNTRPEADADYSRSVHAADLAAFLRALGLGRAHLVGHSYGGSVAALVAMEHPELVRSLVLGDPSLFAVLQTQEAKAHLSAQRETLSAVLAPLKEKKDEQAIRLFLKGVIGADVLDSLPAASRGVIMDNVGTLGPMLATYFDPNRLDCDRARGIETPTLLLTGEFSPKIYGQVVGALDRCMPNAEVSILARASHGLQLERPKEFNEVVLSFLEKHHR
ncbi:MAG TPA: alpha/beta hydrolase, partial [Blastocatellia bacterium]|nr:alpha/beta hydrolase [Blastocatellia bacterium]